MSPIGAWGLPDVCAFTRVRTGINALLAQIRLNLVFDLGHELPAGCSK
jgi:hypothetical protein